MQRFSVALLSLAAASGVPEGYFGGPKANSPTRPSASDYVVVGTIQSGHFSSNRPARPEYVAAHRAEHAGEKHLTEEAYTVVHVREVLSGPADLKAGDSIAVVARHRGEFIGDDATAGAAAVFFLRRSHASSRTALPTFVHGMDGDNLVVLQTPATEDPRCDFVAVTHFECPVVEAVHAPTDSAVDPFAPGELVCDEVPAATLCDAVLWDSFVAAIRADTRAHSASPRP